MMLPHPTDPWHLVLAYARKGCETTAIGRLAHACRPRGLVPSFDISARDRLRIDLDHEILDAVAMINAGLKALRQIKTRRPELDLVVCPKFLSTAEIGRETYRLRFGPVFEASIAVYVAAETAPVDIHGRRRVVLKSIAEKHPNALRHAADLGAKAGLPPVVTISDLVDPPHLAAIVAHYETPTTSAGGRNAMMSVLMRVARNTGNATAIQEITRFRRVLKKPSDTMPLATLRILSPFHDLMRQTAMLGQIGAIAATLTAGWPTVLAVRRCQGALGLLLSFYLIANPCFVWSIRFDPSDDRRRVTKWGHRPRLIAREAPHEPLDEQLPDGLLDLIDVYWAQMPEPLRESREVFVKETGDRMTKGAYVKRCQMVLAELEAGLTPHMLVDLAVLNMVWLDAMTEVEMSLKARFETLRAFKKRYDILLQDIATQRRCNKRRPGRR